MRSWCLKETATSCSFQWLSILMLYYTSAWGACGMWGTSCGSVMRWGWSESFCLHHQHWASPACGEEAESGISTCSAESTWWFWLGFFGMNIPKDEYPLGPLASFSPHPSGSLRALLPFVSSQTLSTLSHFLLVITFPSHWPLCCGYDTPPSAQHPPGLAVLSHTCICRRAASLFLCRIALNLVLHLSSQSLN